MSTERHTMAVIEQTGTQSLFACPVAGCGHRLVFDHVDGRTDVLQRGSGGALHEGTTGPLTFSGGPLRS